MTRALQAYPFQNPGGGSPERYEGRTEDGRTDGGRTEDGRRTDGGRTEDGRRTDGGRRTEILLSNIGFEDWICKAIYGGLDM